MKILSRLFLLAALFSAPAAFAETTAVVNPYGTFLQGDDVEVEMAQMVAKNKDGLNDVILKITGASAFDAGIDGKTIKYQATHGGTGIDYKANGKVRMSVRNPYGNSWSMTQVFLNGKTISLHANQAQSKNVQPLHLLTELEAANKQ